MVHAMENECKEAENDLRQEYEASREEIKVVKMFYILTDSSRILITIKT